MDAVAQIQDVEIAKIIVPTVSVFMPLLEAKRQEIQSVPKQTFKYGDTDRHQLDVYFPTSPSKSGKAPILFFVYGGGFTTGERTLPPPADIAYANVATYFAKRGFLTVIPDYRLVPHVKFPGPSEDLRDAIQWIVSHVAELSTEGTGEPDVGSMFLMGQSAGAVHVSTAYLYPGLMPDDLKARVKGLILIAGAYHLHPADTETGFEELMNVYWGSEEETKKSVPLTLFNNVPDSELSSLPPILLVEGEREPKWVKVVGKDFYDAVKAREGVQMTKVWGKAHNHLSITWCLGTGEGEEWAEDTISWINGVSGK